MWVNVKSMPMSNEWPQFARVVLPNIDSPPETLTVLPTHQDFHRDQPRYRMASWSCLELSDTVD